MCPAQGPQRSDAGEARTRGLWSRVKHSTTEPLRSHNVEFISLKGGCKARTSLHLSKGHVVGNHMSWLKQTGLLHKEDET